MVKLHDLAADNWLKGAIIVGQIWQGESVQPPEAKRGGPQGVSVD